MLFETKGPIQVDLSNPDHVRALRRIESTMIAPRGLAQAEQQSIREAIEKKKRLRKFMIRRRRIAQDLYVMRLLRYANSEPPPHFGAVSTMAMIRAKVQSLPAMACPCRGPLEDPGGYHLPACPCSNPDNPEDCPF